LHVVALNFLHVEAVGLISFLGIFALGLLGHRVQSDRIRIVNEDQIIESEMTSEGAGFGRNAFLHATVTGKTKNVLIENTMLGGIEMRSCHFRGHRDADRIANTLPEWSGGAFHSRRFGIFRVTWRFAVELAKAFDVVDGKVVAAHVEPGIKEHAAVTGRENEIVPANPARLFRVMPEQITIKNRAHLRAAEW